MAPKSDSVSPGASGLNANLLEQLAFYGAYHSVSVCLTLLLATGIDLCCLLAGVLRPAFMFWHPINKLIHFIFVPAIFGTVLVWLAKIPVPALSGPLSTALAAVGLPTSLVLPSAAVVVAAVYAAFYVFLEPLAGLTWTLCNALPLLAAASWARTQPNADAWAAVVHLFSWYMQIHPGHAVFEKRKPALLDSLVQAFALAPLFVWFELLFCLGYRRNLHTKLQARIAQLVPKGGKRA